MGVTSSAPKLQIGRVIVYAGVMLAFFIGAGFATGQEILMYFVSYGSEMFIVICVVFTLLLWSTINFAVAGATNEFRNNSEIFQYYCGKHIGAIYDYFSAIFCFACYIFMVAGAGSSLQQQFGIPNAVGVAVMGVSVMLTVSLGLQKITELLGRLGTVILVVVLLSSLWNLLMNLDMVVPNMKAIDTGGWEQFGMEKSIAPNAVTTGINYMGTVIIWFITFVTRMAEQSDHKREVKAGMVVGSVAIAISLIVCSLAMTAVVQQVGGADAPNLIMAGNIWEPLGAVFAIVVVLGIYTSGVPLLWTPVTRFAEDGSPKAMTLSLALGTVGIVVALFVPYKTLVNYIMNLGGTMTYVLCVFMVIGNIRSLFGFIKRKKAEGRKSKPHIAEEIQQKGDAKTMSLVAGKKIGFIGGGRMGEAIFSGIMSAGLVPPEDMYVADIRKERQKELQEIYGIIPIDAGADNSGIKQMLANVDIVFLAVQPQSAAVLLEDVKDYFDPKKHILVSIMGGVTLAFLQEYLTETPVIRVMPNTPMTVNAGCSGISLGKNAAQIHGDIALELFEAIGIAYLLPENLIDPLTGISGCGPAFCAVFIQALADGGVELGLPRDMAIKIAAQTVVGTGKMVLATNEHPEILKDNVCTPGGGTIAGVRALEMRAFRGTVISAVEDSVARMREVAKNA